jgi:hypothetical protein
MQYKTRKLLFCIELLTNIKPLGKQKNSMIKTTETIEKQNPIIETIIKMNAIINATINKTQLFQPCFLWAEKMYL